MKIKSESVWVDGIRRHLKDLQEDMYEGASGAERKARYVNAFELLTLVALDVLQEVNASLLRGTWRCVCPGNPSGRSRGHDRIVAVDLARARRGKQPDGREALASGHHQRHLPFRFYAPPPRGGRSS